MIACETHEIVEVLAPEYGWNANRAIVSRGNDSVFIIECCDELPQRGTVDPGLIGKRNKHRIPRIVRKNCRQSDRKRRSEPFFPIGIYYYRHRRKARHGWRYHRRVRTENNHHSTGAGVKSGDRAPPYKRLFFMDDQLLWETESRRCSGRQDDCSDPRR